MKGNIDVPHKLSLLKWLPVIAVAALVLACAPKAAMAQYGYVNLGGYVVSGCDITHDNGTYLLDGYDFRGNPYFINENGIYMWTDRDDQEFRSYYYWYIGPDNGEYWTDDYSCNYPCGPMGTEPNGSPIPVYDGPETVTQSDPYYVQNWSFDVNGNSDPTVSLNT